MEELVLRKGALALAAMLLAGCATQKLPVEPPAAEEPIVVVSEPTPPPAEEVSPEPVPAPPPLPPVAIVLSGSQPAYADVARELGRYFDNHEIYDLSDASRPPVSVLRLINDDAPSAVIAVGLRAAQSSVAMSEQPVVFSQVFNYRHHELLRDNSRGVAALPPTDAQLAAWKEFDPTVTRLGLIVGEGHEDLVSEAEIAAQRHGVQLVVQVTSSDQETLYFFRRMVRDIDGFWLLPDNRVLSARVLQQMLAEAEQQQVAVSVPTESMLSLGAMISMTSTAADIAAKIAGIVRSIQAGNLDRVPPITGLSEIRVVTKGATPVGQR
jgi:ABC-type uncharacterized transport system substrate-binding protein